MSTKATLVWSLVGVVIMVVATVHAQAVKSSYSHWCPAIERKRVSCVARASSAQAHSLSRNGSPGNQPSILRRVYRWKKQFVLRCCPGFMGPNCQQACFSCRGYDTMTKRLDNIERMVQQAYNGGGHQQVQYSESPRRREGLEPLQRYPTTSGYDKTQYPAASVTRRRSQRVHHEERRVLAHLRGAQTSSRSIERPVVVAPPPEMVVSLSGFSNDESEGTEGDAPQSDQNSNDSEHAPQRGSSGVYPTSGKSVSQSDDSKPAKWTQEQTLERNGENGFTNSPTAEVESVWKHWDDEFQVRLSTLERQVLELEAKLSAIGPTLISMTSLTDQIGLLTKRIETIEMYTGISDSDSMPNPSSVGNHQDKLKDGAAEKDSIPVLHSSKQHQSSSSENRAKGPGSNTTHPSVNKPPVNLSFDGKLSKVSREYNARPNGSLTSSFARAPSDGHPNNMTSSNSSMPCPSSCHDQKLPSRPPPPPLPDQQTLEKVFSNDSNLVNALQQGHTQFYQHLRTALKKNSTDEFSNVALNDSKPKRIVLGGHGQPPETRAGSLMDSEQGEHDKTNIKLHGNMATNGHRENEATRHEKNNIGQAMARHGNGSSSNGVSLSPSTSLVLRVLLYILVTVAFRR